LNLNILKHIKSILLKNDDNPITLIGNCPSCMSDAILENKNRMPFVTHYEHGHLIGGSREISFFDKDEIIQFSLDVNCLEYQRANVTVDDENLALNIIFKCNSCESRQHLSLLIGWFEDESP